MNYEEAYNLLIDHNCAGPCPCEQCAEAKNILEEERERVSRQEMPEV